MSGTYDKYAGPNNHRLDLNATRVAEMSDTLPLDLNSNPLGIERRVSGIADPFNGHIDEFRIVHVQRSDGRIQTAWNNKANSVAFSTRAGLLPFTARAGPLPRRSLEGQGQPNSDHPHSRHSILTTID